MDAPSERLSTSTVHVVYFDRVNSSSIPLERRVKIDEQLRSYVRSLQEVKDALAREQLIQIDTGDGLSLVFLGDPQLAAETALLLGRYSEANADHPLRIAVHTGTVTLRQGLASSPSVAGPGIDIAAHLMQIAQPSIPLFSNSIADLLMPLEVWSNLLRDAGVVEIKHARLIHVFQPADSPTFSGKHTAAIIVDPKTDKGGGSSRSPAPERRSQRRALVAFAVLLVGAFAVWISMSKWLGAGEWVTIYRADFKAPVYEIGHVMGPDDRWHIEAGSMKVVEREGGREAWFEPGAGALIGIDQELKIKRLLFRYEIRVDLEQWPPTSDGRFGFNINLNRDNTAAGDALQIWLNHRVNNGVAEWVVEGPVHRRIPGPSILNKWVRIEAEWLPNEDVVHFRFDDKFVASVPTSATPHRFVRLIQPYADHKDLPGMRVRLIELKYVPDLASN